MLLFHTIEFMHWMRHPRPVQIMDRQIPIFQAVRYMVILRPRYDDGNNRTYLRGASRGVWNTWRNQWRRRPYRADSEGYPLSFLGVRVQLVQWQKALARLTWRWVARKKWTHHAPGTVPAITDIESSPPILPWVESISGRVAELYLWNRFEYVLNFKSSHGGTPFGPWLDLVTSIRVKGRISVWPKPNEYNCSWRSSHLRDFQLAFDGSTLCVTRQSQLWPKFRSKCEIIVFVASAVVTISNYQ